MDMDMDYEDNGPLLLLLACSLSRNVTPTTPSACLAKSINLFILLEKASHPIFL
jgi:hypothetical protein